MASNASARDPPGDPAGARLVPDGLQGEVQLGIGLAIALIAIHAVRRGAG